MKEKLEAIVAETIQALEDRIVSCTQEVISEQERQTPCAIFTECFERAFEKVQDNAARTALWKQLTLKFHPDKFANETFKFKDYLLEQRCESLPQQVLNDLLLNESYFGTHDKISDQRTPFRGAIQSLGFPANEVKIEIIITIFSRSFTMPITFPLTLPPAWELGLRVTCKNDGDYLLPLSNALKKLQIESTLNHFGVPLSADFYYSLDIKFPIELLQPNFAVNLKKCYQQELAEINESLFYVRNSDRFKTSVTCLFGALMSIALVVFAALGIVPGGLIAIIVGALAAVGFLITSLVAGYQSIKIGKGSGIGSSLASLLDDPEKQVDPIRELKEASRQQKDPSYTTVVGELPSSTATNQEDSKNTNVNKC